MASWFSSAGLNSAFDSLSETVQSVKESGAFDTLTETVQSVSESVQDAIPTEHKDFLAKLTLNTDEMISERENFREEATRKEAAKNRLNKILPWETLDPEREILVEECKEAILELSGREDTFFGPYQVPLLNVQLETTKEEDEEENDGQVDGEIEPGKDGEETPVEEAEPTVEEEIRAPVRHLAPSEESLEKLSNLKPLPPLLEDFNLDTHVGLIQRVMNEDPKLVGMQANFSGGGARERTFWRNYFFHCAFARYEAGLSLDEIWSYEDEINVVTHVENASMDDAGDTPSSIGGGNEEEEVLFDGSGDTDANAQNAEQSSAVESAVDLDAEIPGTTEGSLAELSELSPKNGFELIDSDVDGTGDPELDELEAEIARELEGL